MHAVYLQQVLDTSNASVQRWTLVLPTSNAYRWLTVILKQRFCFARRFSCFITSLAHCNPYACCPPLCFGLAPSFASFSTLCPVFRVLHRFPLYCIVFRAPFASFSVPCIVFRISHRFLHLLCFIAYMSLALLGFPAVLFYRLHLHLGL